MTPRPHSGLRSPGGCSPKPGRRQRSSPAASARPQPPPGRPSTRSAARGSRTRARRCPGSPAPRVRARPPGCLHPPRSAHAPPAPGWLQPPPRAPSPPHAPRSLPGPRTSALGPRGGLRPRAPSTAPRAPRSTPAPKPPRPRPRGGQAREPPPASRAADRRGGSGPRNCVPRRRRTRLPSTRRAMPSVRAAARPAAASAPPRRAPTALVPPSAPRQARGAAEGRPEGARQAVAAAHWPLQASLIRVANGRRPGRGYGAGGIFLTGAGRPAEGGVCRGRPAPSLLRRGPSDRHPSRAFGTVSFAPGIWFLLFLGPLFSLPPALPPTSPFPGLMHPWPPHPLPLCLRGGYLPSGLRCI